MAKRTDISGHSFKWMVYLIDLFIHIAIFSFMVYFVVEKAGWRDYDNDLSFYYDRFGQLYVLILSFFAAISTFKIKIKDLDSAIETLFRAVFQVILTYIYFAISVAILYHTFPGHLLMWSGLCALVLIPLSHYVIAEKVIRNRKKHENIIKTVVIGADYNSIRLYDFVKKGISINSYSVLGFFSSTKTKDIPEDSILLGAISDVCIYLENNEVNQVFCALDPAVAKAEIDPIIKICDSKYITFCFVPNMDGYPSRKMRYSRIGDVTVLDLHNEPLEDAYCRIEKRTFDIILSSILLVTVYPLVWIIVAPIIKITSPGPILFRQKRTGYNGKSFNCLKFRSMRVNADADKVQATADDPRKTRFGNFLRRSSIDEIPQLINIFKGEMSFVGPRPHMDILNNTYSSLISGYFVRYFCRPGITGWAQVNGCRGETKTTEEMENRIRHDIWYIENWSFFLDLRIIAKTLILILKKDKQAY